MLTDGSNGRGVEPEVTAAEDADALVDVFADLPDHIELQTQEGEITVWFALAAACLALAAASCSLVWNRMS